MFDDYLLRRNQPRASEQARLLAFREWAGATQARTDPYAETQRLLRGDATLPFGTLPDGRSLDVGLETARLTGLVIGAPGSGKTRLLLYLGMAGLKWSLGQRPGGATGPDTLQLIDKFVDFKGETDEEMRKEVVALYLDSDEATQERIEHSIRVVAWSRDAVAPSAPFDNARGTVSDAYLADLRVGIEVASSSSTYTDGVRQALFMLYRLLIAKRYPPNFRYCQRLFSDAAFRARQLEGVGDRDLRGFYGRPNLSDVLANQTAEAALRRIRYGRAFPEIDLATGIPPVALDRLLPKTEPLLTLENCGVDASLPPSKLRERAINDIIDTLLEAMRGGGRVPRRLVIEEAAAFLSTAGELTEPLANNARLARSRLFGVVYAAQDFTNALRAPLVETLTLNSQWWAIFQSRKEGEWIAPYAADVEDGAKGRAAFTDTIRSLQRQHYYFYAKRGKALPVKAPDVVAPEVRTGRSSDELLEIFRTKIAVHSLIPARVAEEEIARWEAEVVDAEPTPSAKPKRRSPKGIADLLHDLEDEDV